MALSDPAPEARQSEWVTIARIQTTHGRIGELKAEIARVVDSGYVPYGRLVVVARAGNERGPTELQARHGRTFVRRELLEQQGVFEGIEVHARAGHARGEQLAAFERLDPRRVD